MHLQGGSRAMDDLQAPPYTFVPNLHSEIHSMIVHFRHLSIYASGCLLGTGSVRGQGKGFVCMQVGKRDEIRFGFMKIMVLRASGGAGRAQTGQLQ